MRDIETRVSVLGHIQRGGSPQQETVSLASQYGARAVEVLLEGKRRRRDWYEESEVVDYDLTKAFAKDHTLILNCINCPKSLSDLIESI